MLVRPLIRRAARIGARRAMRRGGASWSLRLPLVTLAVLVLAGLLRSRLR